jgi:hypothetical protein
MSNNLYVFDLDHTLAVPDKEADERAYYFQIHHLEPVPEMVALFDRAQEKKILTNRHPALQKELEHIWKCPVHCRPYALDWETIKTVNESNENLEIFMEGMVHWKTLQLNAWAILYDNVVYYEDQIMRFNKHIELADNITILDPADIIAVARRGKQE